MTAFLKKITSRKFLTCIAGVILGVCMTFGLDEGTVNIIAGAITSISSVVIYIYSEGKIDAAAVGKIKDTVEQVTGAIDAVEKVGE
jgi:phage shock protein PspC (stress-responsive transcriptional regulator)